MIQDLLATAGISALTATSNTLPARVSQSSARLFAILQPMFPTGNVHPMTALERREYPDCVYEIGTADSMTYEAMEIAHVVNMFITIRDPDYAVVVETTDALVAELELHAGINVVDFSGDYEDAQELYRIALEIEISTPAGVDDSNDSASSVLILPTQCKAPASPYDGGCIQQLLSCQHAIVIQDTTPARVQETRERIMGTLLGKQIAPDHHPLQYAAGNVLEPGGGLAGWVDTFVDSHRVRAA